VSHPADVATRDELEDIAAAANQNRDGIPPVRALYRHGIQAGIDWCRAQMADDVPVKRVAGDS
jgi:hypothetical protein